MKLLFGFVFVLSFLLPFAGGNFAFAEIPSSVRVVYSNANVYKVDGARDESNVIATYPYGTVLVTIGTSKMVGSDGLDYYKVELTDVDGFEFGYVLVSQVLDVSVVSPQKKLDTNATLSKQAEVYNLRGNDYQKSDIILEKDTKVKILSGYSKDNEFTQIQYQQEDGQIMTAYVKTLTLQTSGISRTLIGTIIIVATAISLTLIIFGVGGKRKKKKTQK